MDKSDRRARPLHAVLFKEAKLKKIQEAFSYQTLEEHPCTLFSGFPF